MKNLWVFTRDYDTLKPSNSVPFPSYICVAFSNSEMARRIWEERDLAVRTIGRCVEALVVDQLAADVESSKRFVGKDVELACLLAVLGTENDYMELTAQPSERDQIHENGFPRVRQFLLLHP
jgi:hypothetical protein